MKYGISCYPAMSLFHSPCNVQGEYLECSLGIFLLPLECAA